MTSSSFASAARPLLESLRLGRARSWIDRLGYLSAALLTIGTAIPTLMMINGALRLDITYHWWAWAGLPAAWVPGVAAALLLRFASGPASLVLFLAAAFGTAFFWPEFGLFTFGPVCIFAAAIYAREMRRGLSR